LAADRTENAYFLTGNNEAASITPIVPCMSNTFTEIVASSNVT
jgi:hypothetical protein